MSKITHSVVMHSEYLFLGSSFAVGDAVYCESVMLVWLH